MVMSFISSMLPGFFEQSSANNAMQQSYENQRLLNQQSLDLSKDYTNWLNTTQYKAMRKGLETAGYNPMLAINKDPLHGTIQGGSANAISADVGNTVANAHRAFNLETKRNEADIDNIRAGIKATNAGVALTNEQTKTEQYRQKQMESETALTNINRLLGNKQLNWYDKRQLAEIKTMYINAQANHLASEASQLNAHTAQAQYNLQKGITDYENVERAAISKWNREHPNQKQWITGIGQWTGALGKVFTGSASYSKK